MSTAQLRLLARPAQPQQTKLLFIPRLPPNNRPGPKSKAPVNLNSGIALGGRRPPKFRVGGTNKQLVIDAFEESRVRFAQGQAEASDDKDGNIPRSSLRRRRRLGNTREKKLQAILYIERKREANGPDGIPGKIISRSKAAKTLSLCLVF
jgi:hypothetical protein